ncbi:hypothetical protein D7V80_02300 [Corallococcus sp. CA054B]|nr:hypothetical protein D7V80_02300 [Corallococcus sp. CA054B]
MLAVLMLWGTGCGSDPEPPPPPQPQSPTLVESTQSAVNLMANETVAFHFAAKDAAQRTLKFSWEARLGAWRSRSAPRRPATCAGPAPNACPRERASR